MPQAILVILDRKEFEEGLAAYYWAQPLDVQAGFVRAYGLQPAETPAGLRGTISHIVASMSDAELGALAQCVLVS